MFSAQTPTYHSNKAYNMFKQNVADQVANHADVKLEFAEAQPEAFRTAKATPSQSPTPG